MMTVTFSHVPKDVSYIFYQCNGVLSLSVVILWMNFSQGKIYFTLRNESMLVTSLTFLLHKKEDNEVNSMVKCTAYKFIATRLPYKDVSTRCYKDFIL